MKWNLVVVCFLLVGMPACGLRQRELELEQKLEEVNQLKQELLLKEKSLQIKEEQLAAREKHLDSTTQLVDTLAAKYPKLPGTWTVNMNCTVATCTGFAVGDVKNEQWSFSFQNNKVIARAMSGQNLVRVYTGTYTGNVIELIPEQDVATNPQPDRVVVRLQRTSDTEMNGQREINRPDDNCRVVYALDLTKL